MNIKPNYIAQNIQKLETKWSFQFNILWIEPLKNYGLLKFKIMNCQLDLGLCMDSKISHYVNCILFFMDFLVIKNNEKH
jgi:hypothetical protein